jgi:hypothetical protein
MLFLAGWAITARDLPVRDEPVCVGLLLNASGQAWVLQC